MRHPAACLRMEDGREEKGGDGGTRGTGAPRPSCGSPCTTARQDAAPPEAPPNLLHTPRGTSGGAASRRAPTAGKRKTSENGNVFHNLARWQNDHPGRSGEYGEGRNGLEARSTTAHGHAIFWTAPGMAWSADCLRQPGTTLERCAAQTGRRARETGGEAGGVTSFRR